MKGETVESFDEQTINSLSKTLGVDAAAIELSTAPLVFHSASDRRRPEDGIMVEAKIFPEEGKVS